MARSLSYRCLLSCWCVANASTARPTPSADVDAAGGNMSFVKAWCAGTEYPKLCDATLAPYEGVVGGSPAQLAWAALMVTLAGERNATAAVRGMTAAGHLAPVAAEAARDCVSMLGDAVGVLRQSVEAMARVRVEQEQGGRACEEGQARGGLVDNVRTGPSAALTDDEMCMAGLKGEGGRREAVRGHVMGLANLTANALGVVNAMAAKQTP